MGFRTLGLSLSIHSVSLHSLGDFPFIPVNTFVGDLYNLRRVCPFLPSLFLFACTAFTLSLQTLILFLILFLNLKLSIVYVLYSVNIYFIQEISIG